MEPKSLLSILLHSEQNVSETQHSVCCTTLFTDLGEVRSYFISFMMNECLSLLLKKPLSTVPGSEHGREETRHRLKGRGQIDEKEPRTKVVYQISWLLLTWPAVATVKQKGCSCFQPKLYLSVRCLQVNQILQHKETGVPLNYNTGNFAMLSCVVVMFTFVSDQWKNMISCNSRTENCTSCAGLNSFRHSCRQAFILNTSCSKKRTWMGKLPFVPQCWIWLEWSPTPEDKGGKPDVSDPIEGII